MSVSGQIIMQSPQPQAARVATGQQVAGNDADSALDRPFSGLFSEALETAHGVENDVPQGEKLSGSSALEGLQDLSPGGNPLPPASSAQAQIAQLAMRLGQGAANLPDHAGVTGDCAAAGHNAGDGLQPLILNQSLPFNPVQAAVLDPSGDATSLSTARADLAEVMARVPAAADVLRALGGGRGAVVPGEDSALSAGFRATDPTTAMAGAAGLEALPAADLLSDSNFSERLDISALLARVKMTSKGVTGFGSTLGQGQVAGLVGTAPGLTSVDGVQGNVGPGRATTDGLTLDIPVRQQGWDEALGNRVTWLVGRNIQRADLQLNPPQLGPLEVRIRMDHDGTSVAFTSQHAAIREALEAAIPRLREMLGEQGVNLCDVDVSGHSSTAQHDDSSRPDAGPGAELAGDPADAALEEGESVSAAAPVSEGLLNVFA